MYTFRKHLYNYKCFYYRKFYILKENEEMSKRERMLPKELEEMMNEARMLNNIIEAGEK